MITATFKMLGNPMNKDFTAIFKPSFLPIRRKTLKTLNALKS
jgi:hypothetical protein